MPLGGGVRQSGITAGGAVAGRDVVYAPTYSDITINNGPRPESTLGRLYRRLRDEAEGDQALTEYIGQLQIFTRVVENEEVVGLEAKLEVAERADQIDMALAMKEMTYSQLRENIFSRTFQTIYATLMGKIFEEFETWVKPAILDGADRRTIDELVNMKVVRPIAYELEQCGECTDPPVQMVRGMIYFLTGNCHIKWR